MRRGKTDEEKNYSIAASSPDGAADAAHRRTGGGMEHSGLK